MDKKTPTTLSQEDIAIFQTMEMALQDTDETFPQSCMRYGKMSDDDLLKPMQAALRALCKDNPKLKADEFDAWYHSLIEDEDMFRLDKKTIDVLEDVRIVFNERTNDWTTQGSLESDYDANYAFLGIIGMALYSIYHKLRGKYDALRQESDIR